jgi:hypothetical protein
MLLTPEEAAEFMDSRTLLNRKPDAAAGCACPSRANAVPLTMPLGIIRLLLTGSLVSLTKRVIWHRSPPPRSAADTRPESGLAGDPVVVTVEFARVARLATMNRRRSRRAYRGAVCVVHRTARLGRGRPPNCGFRACPGRRRCRLLRRRRSGLGWPRYALRRSHRRPHRYRGRDRDGRYDRGRHRWLRGRSCGLWVCR